MKQIISLCLVVFFSTGIFATPSLVSDSSLKIQKVFQHDFPEVTFFKVYPLGDNYMVYYKETQNESSGRVYYDAEGNILQTFKYYSGQELAPFIRAKIVKKYSGKNISNVTEVTNNEEHYYQIILKDSTQMFIINYDTEGNLHLKDKYKRAWIKNAELKPNLCRYRFGFSINCCSINSYVGIVLF